MLLRQPSGPIKSGPFAPFLSNEGGAIRGVHSEKVLDASLIQRTYSHFVFTYWITSTMFYDRLWKRCTCIHVSFKWSDTDWIWMGRTRKGPTCICFFILCHAFTPRITSTCSMTSDKDVHEFTIRLEVLAYWSESHTKKSSMSLTSIDLLKFK